MDTEGEENKRIFSDPEDNNLVNEIITTLKSLKKDALVGYIRRISPDWIVSEHSDYSSELINFSNNWTKVCSMCGATKAGIILVREIIFSDPEGKYKIMINAGEELTKNGYSVRRHIELCGCKRCNKAILSKQLSEKYHRLFTGYCKSCESLLS